jgi:hypothetical protein
MVPKLELSSVHIKISKSYSFIMMLIDISFGKYSQLAVTKFSRTNKHNLRQKKLLKLQ